MKPGDAQAAYWLGNVSRRELQKTLDEYTAELKTILDDFRAGIAQARAMVLNIDMAVQLLADRAGLVREDFVKFSTEKLAAAKASAAASRGIKFQYGPELCEHDREKGCCKERECKFYGTDTPDWLANDAPV